MAKFADVTYGTHGDSERYTYVVNDNVRSGDYLHPSVKHWKSGKIFGTTAIVQSLTKETTARAKEKYAEIESHNAALKRAGEERQVSLVSAYTGKELGIGAERNASGKFVGNNGVLGKTVKSSDGIFTAPKGKTFEETPFIQKVRQGNVNNRTKEPDTYEEYARAHNLK